MEKVTDSYNDFIIAMLNYAKKKQSRCDLLVDLLSSNPDITTSEVIRFVSEQPDFYEDAAPIYVG